MTPYPKALTCLFMTTAAAVFVILLAQPARSNEPSVLGNAIPLIEGATILEEKQFEGSGRFEFEVGISPSEAVEFYHQAMQAKGWPPGRVMSNGKTCVLMLMRQGDMITVQAKNKGDRTHVTLSVVLKSSIEKALDPQTAQRHHKVTEPVPATQDKTIPPDRGVTIEGTPITKGELVHRYQFPERNRSGASFDKKDGGNLPDDPSPPPKDDEPETEDPSSEDAFPSESAFDIHDDLPDSLYALIRATVRWQVTDPDEYRYSGSVSLHLKGHMKLWEAASPTVQGGHGAFQPARTYRAEGGSVSYVYDEQRISLKPIPSGHCQDPLIVEYRDVGKLPLSYKGIFKMHRYASMAAPYLQNLSVDKQRFLSAFKSAAPLPDYYELILGPAKTEKRIPGRRKESGEKVCTYTPVDRSFPGCLIGIQVEPQASGQLTGSRTWQADDQGLCPPSLSISIQEIAATQNQKPLKPPAGGNMNVTYSLSWQLSENDPTSRPEADPLTVENWERDCANMQNRANFIQIVLAAYGNQAVREAIKKIIPDEPTRKKLYQAVIERLAIDAANQDGLTIQEKIAMAANAGARDVDGYLADEATTLPSDQTKLTDDDPKAKTLLWTKPLFAGDQFLGTEIMGKIGGKPVVLEKYDANGKLIQSVDPDAILSEWEASNGQLAGRSRLDNALQHERVHVRQYTKLKSRSKSIDMLGDWELEAFQTEMDGLLNDIDGDC